MKKFLALLLSLLLLFGMFPLTVVAATAPAGDEDPHCPNCGSDGYDPYGTPPYIIIPNCTEEGFEPTGYCSAENKVVGRSTPALGHQWNNGTLTKMPTCTEEGIVHRECQRILGSGGPQSYSHKCDATWDAPIPALGHDFGEWIRVKEPTPQEPGLEKRYCSRCDAEEERPMEYIPPKVEYVRFNKTLFSTPANGEYFVLGEEIEYGLNLYDDVLHKTMGNIVFTDPCLPGGSFSSNDIGSECTMGYTYTVTAADVERGYIENTAHVSFAFMETNETHSLVSNTVTVPTGKGDRSDEGALSISKQVISNPQNGAFYVPGETVHYAITVTVPENETSQNITLHDVKDSTFLPHVAFNGTRVLYFDYTVTEADATQGYVGNVAFLTWTDNDGTAKELYSNYVEVPTGIDGNAQAGYPILAKVEYEFSNPHNGKFYVEGETVLFDVIISNPENGLPISDIMIYDYLFNGISYMTQTEDGPASLAPGEFYIQGFAVTVTKQDVERGFITNMARASYRRDGEFHLTPEASCTVFTGEELPLTTLNKKVISSPANGLYYVPGEQVSYEVTFTVLGEDPIYDVVLFDYGVRARRDEMQPGESISMIVTLTVWDIDAMVGSLTNVAQVTALTKNGTSYLTYSPEVVVPVGLPYGFGVITDIDVTKAETSSPQNGSYYEVGEVISYNITVTNTGETGFEEVIVYDSMAPGSGEIASIENFFPGSSRSYTFKHTVTEADTANGFAVNQAYAYGSSGGNILLNSSNYVFSYCDGVMVWVPPEELDDILPPGTMDGPGSLPGDKGTFCDCHLVQKGEGSRVYELSYCAIHKGTKTAVAEIMAADFGNAESFAMARALWEQDLMELYDALSLHADALGNITLLKNRLTFFALVNNTEAVLNSLYPNDLAYVHTAVLQLLEEQANTLCYELHNAPANRSDSLQAKTPAPALAKGELCSLTRTEDKGKVTKSLCLCEEHVLTDNNTTILLNSTTPLRAWTGIELLWKMELQNSFKAMAEPLNEEGLQLLGGYFRSLSDYINAREKQLMLLYPEKPETVAETVTKLLVEQVTELCGMVPAVNSLYASDTAAVTPSGKGFRGK